MAWSLKDEEEDLEAMPLLSLLDVLSCGLGAAVFLCVIFSAPRSGEHRVTSPIAGMVASFETEHDALLTLLVKAPNHPAVVELDLRKVKLGEPVNFQEGFQVVLYGFAHAGDADPKGARRRYIAYFNRLEEGSWKIGVRYFSRNGDPLTWPIDQGIIVRGRLAVASTKKVPKQDTAEPNQAFPSLRLGDSSWFAPVDVRGF